ncbi:MAG: hypothetical protein GYA61_03285 [Spirochaetales bacterium]|nr:hypothetical protein [Spirochaetales bacterium]
MNKQNKVSLISYLLSLISYLLSLISYLLSLISYRYKCRPSLKNRFISFNNNKKSLSFSSASVFIPNFIHPFIRNLIPIFLAITISILLFILFFLFIFIPSSSPIFADSSSISSIQDIVVNDQVLSNIVSFESLHFTAGYK